MSTRQQQRSQFTHMTPPIADEIGLNCSAVSFLHGAIGDPAQLDDHEALVNELQLALLRIELLLQAAMTGEPAPPEAFSERFDGIRERHQAIIDAGVFSVHRKPS